MTSTPAYESILVDVDGPIGTITLNRPDRLNSWDWLMSAEIGHALGRFDSDDEIRAIVLTGAGRAFCAGAGLLPAGRTFDGSLTREEAEARYPGPHRPADRIRTPVISAVNGHAVGAGMTMALRADIIVAAEDAKLGFVFNRRGVIPDADLLWSLPRLIGYSRAMDLLLTGRIFSGTEAVALGIASRAVPADSVVATAKEIAADIATNVAPVSAAITKLVGRRFLEETDRNAALELERDLFRWAGRHADAPEGVNAFREKRAPRWTLSKTKDFPVDLFDDGA
ncbi:enoyl-CoA hydratase/isomerase family protein [Actinomadura sp. WMMB 499]|uniref:enoyl-CoA hydratase/isomerase family protein n=1 Tax=Actinomadura sp. WMMB 499 TaxID=1219491 RepID=UPI001246BC7C|nr:enoyl-CoA hydratase-related protein [Actinomadura sp. WMMB 499]QFG21622.1 enoyl-CoA hydratase [Actinomadura sp. WMMB 499]